MFCIGGLFPRFRLGVGAVDKLDLVGGIFVGAIRDVEYQSQVITLKPGHALVLYTDGVTEAMDAHHEEFEEKRLQACLENAGDLSVEALTCRVFDEVKAFAAGARQNDDITVLTLRYHGPQAAAQPTTALTRGRRLQ